MYINFNLLFQSKLSIDHLFILQAVKQKEYIVCEANQDVVKELLNEGYITELKKEGYKLADKGSSFLDTIERAKETPEVLETAAALIELYDNFGKLVGKKLTVEERLAWFISNTAFSKDTIVKAVDIYLQSSGDYTMSLENLVWKPQSVAFSVHMNLKDSKLFDLICRDERFQMDPRLFFKDNQDKRLKYLFAIVQAGAPPTNMEPECYITMNRKGDLEGLMRIKKALVESLKLRK